MKELYVNKDGVEARFHEWGNKKIEEADHILHWNKLNEVIKEILYWFK